MVRSRSVVRSFPLTGLIVSLGTTWGLFRHYWVVIKFGITVVCGVILFMYTQTLEQLGELARDPALSIEALRNDSPALHASAAIVALLVKTVLSVYKPRGMTAYGRSKIESRGFQAEPSVVLSAMTSTAFERDGLRGHRDGYTCLASMPSALPCSL